MRKILCASILLLNFFYLEAQQVPLIVYYSDSHRCLFEEWFKPSLQDDFVLLEHKIEQVCPSGEFMEVGWKEAMEKKLEIILETMDHYWGEIIVYSDVDIQFFRPVKEELLLLMEGHDLLIQLSNQGGYCCAGFIVLRANEATKEIFEMSLRFMKKGLFNEDESAINKCLKKVKTLKWNHLPETFYCGGTYTGKKGKHWFPGAKLRIPENIALHHANYTIGMENKIKQLEYVRSIVSPK